MSTHLPGGRKHKKKEHAMNTITYRLFENGFCDIITREPIETVVGLSVHFVDVPEGTTVTFAIYGREAEPVRLIRTINDQGNVTIPQNMLQGRIDVEIDGMTCESILCSQLTTGQTLVIADDYEYRTKLQAMMSHMDHVLAQLRAMEAKQAEFEETLERWSRGYDVE